jgi:AmmeMemoRadiSam system protein B
MHTRRPAVASQFYPGTRTDCVEEIETMLKQCPVDQLNCTLPDNITAAIVPHAGWFFSGTLATMTLAAIKQQNSAVDTFIIFGAAHSFYGSLPAVYNTGKWQTPMGDIDIDSEIAQKIIAAGAAKSDPDAHIYEHSIEVQVPIIQYLFENAAIVPVIVPATSDSIPLGNAVADIIRKNPDKKIVCLASTDLTHYGPRYGFTPKGPGAQGCQWAFDVNDKLFIDAVMTLDADKILQGSSENSFCCGPGPTAAVIAVAKQLIADSPCLLAHTNSNDIMMEKMNRSSSESVGYAAIVF